jgi:hypothetical protein
MCIFGFFYITVAFIPDDNSSTAAIALLLVPAGAAWPPFYPVDAAVQNLELRNGQLRGEHFFFS